ncbi:hypothetical protein JTE90_028131 [Oedothorax gibbosus]|uniref:adenosine deaminase n=1 Tax=Oedothorax gibbosus TaxID=931172 RepID=A0AAV6V9P4_9ARAC|nr:hypothetical protein JTE90_028131 [Oedothorax gibbosus]
MAGFIQFDPTKQPRCKVELHAHLDGSVRLTTVWELAEKKGIKLQAHRLEDLLDCCSIKQPSTLTDFLKPFFIYMPIISGDAEAIERMAYEFCEDAVKEGVLYSEVRYCPQLMTHSEFSKSGPLTVREVCHSVSKGLARGGSDFNLTVRSILCCFRANPEWCDEIVDLCMEFRDYGVVGMDVAGDESIGPFDPLTVSAFKRAAEAGIHRTAHAGEAGPASNVQQAVTEMHAERIGHGYHTVDDPDVYARCTELGTHFEVCPYSSCLTGSVPLSSTKHPIVKFAEDGVNFSISRDDPTLIQKTLDQEYELLRGYGLKDVHFTRANFNAVRSCFLPEDEKEQLLKQVTAIYNGNTDVEYIPVRAMNKIGGH